MGIFLANGIRGDRIEVANGIRSDRIEMANGIRGDRIEVRLRGLISEPA
jgi:hypothetical protein